jgi:hypothetical protein
MIIGCHSRNEYSTPILVTIGNMSLVDKSKTIIDSLATMLLNIVGVTS